ncbi:MAG: hypothetical protein ACXVGH_03375 [Mycobacteriales bacterium]
MTTEQSTLTTADLAAQASAEQPPVEQDRPEQEVTLLDPAATASFQDRWGRTQTRFVDDPRAAVQEADALVADLMRSLAQGFADHKASLEEQWNRDSEPDTEQLRQALQRYRLLFGRLLAT